MGDIIKTVLLIAGGTWQVPLAKKIKEMGYNLICSNLYANSPAFAYASKSFVCDVLNEERNLQFAIDNNIDAVVSDQSDISMITVAYIAEKLGLATNGLKLAELFHNKALMRKFCKEKGFASPDFKECLSVQDALSFFEGKDNIVIKPLDSQAGRGFFKISSKEDLIKNFDETMQFNNSEKVVLAEDFISGREFTVDGIFINGVHHSLAVSIKSHYDYAPNIANELYFTNEDTRYDIAALKEHNNKLMNSTGAFMGLTHNEYKLMDGKFVLVEMSNRGGGNDISYHITPLMSGVDNMGTYIHQALGDKQAFLQSNIEKKPCAILKFFDTHDFGGRNNFIIHSIKGLDKVSAMPNVIDVRINYNLGDTFKHAKNGTNRPGYYIAYADNRQQLDSLHQEIINTIKID